MSSRAKLLGRGKAGERERLAWGKGKGELEMMRKKREERRGEV
jgi:hypothetical protein